jgi:sporulation protein YlmC with PRC-barrel domain
MEKLFSNIIGTPVLDDDIGRPLTTVKDLVIDPESGKVVGVLVDIHKNLIIAPVDILSWGDTLKIHTSDSIAPGDEILRVAEVQKRNIHIFHSRVETKKKEYIGDVFDFSVNVETLVLQKIYTAKSILGLFRYDSRIIPAKNIEKILPNKIIVTENTRVVYEKAKASASFEDLAVSG